MEILSSYACSSRSLHYNPQPNNHTRLTFASSDRSASKMSADNSTSVDPDRISTFFPSAILRSVEYRILNVRLSLRRASSYWLVT